MEAFEIKKNSFWLSEFVMIWNLLTCEKWFGMYLFRMRIPFSGLKWAKYFMHGWKKRIYYLFIYTKEYKSK